MIGDPGDDPENHPADDPDHRHDYNSKTVQPPIHSIQPVNVMDNRSSILKWCEGAQQKQIRISTVSDLILCFSEPNTWYEKHVEVLSTFFLALKL